MEVLFCKANASGNDFIMIDNRNGLIKNGLSDFVRTISHRRFAIGADGVIFIENSPLHQFSMKYYNADGSLGSLCGNGARCTAKYIYEKIIKKDTIVFEAIGKKFSAEVFEDSVKLYFQDLEITQSSLKLKNNGDSIISYFLDTGSPHIVIFMEDLPRPVKLSDLDVYELGKAIRNLPEFKPHGTNVNFVDVLSDSSIEIRTYERGVENETFACGTGSIASAIISYKIRSLQLPIKVLTKGKEFFTIGFTYESGTAKNLFLEGPARIVFTGSFFYNPITKSISFKE